MKIEEAPLNLFGKEESLVDASVCRFILFVDGLLGLRGMCVYLIWLLISSLLLFIMQIDFLTK